MRKIILVFSFVLLSVVAMAQNASPEPTEMSHVDSLKVGILQQISEHIAPRYKLYPTENMWTFLELDTLSGRIWQVQYSIEGPDYRYKIILNDEWLLPDYDPDGGFAGRFELYKTQNMYNFILLDTQNGRTWQVQWSTKQKERFVIRIL